MLHHRSSQASVNREKEWNACCRDVLGWSMEEEEEEQIMMQMATNAAASLTANNNHNRKITLVNLLDPSHNAIKSKKNNNINGKNTEDFFWNQAIQEMQDNLNRMILWLNEKKIIYLLPQTSNEEASLIQSTLSSYTVTTANELERLRRHYQQQTHSQSGGTLAAKSPQQQSHDMLVIQILSERLKEFVAEPFSKLQKHRQRAAVALWQEPLSCRFVPSLQRANDDDDERDELDHVLGLDQDDHHHNFSRENPRRFLPTRPRHVWKREEQFWDAYQQPVAATMTTHERPTTWLSPRWKRPRSPGQPQQQSPQPSPGSKRSKPSYSTTATTTTTNVNSLDDQDDTLPYQAVDEEQLHQESTLLQAQQQEHDLDAVQHMETTMVEITTLLSQFSELVSSQQEDVWQIHDAVATTKENMEQGQEQLADAAHRTDQSKHVMASAIAGMGMALLFFHWIRP